MKISHLIFPYFILILLCFSCSSSDEKDSFYLKQKNQKGEYIYRKHQESLTLIDPPKKMAPKNYPWNHNQTDNFSKTTKESCATPRPIPSCK